MWNWVRQLFARVELPAELAGRVDPAGQSFKPSCESQADEESPVFQEALEHEDSFDENSEDAEPLPFEPLPFEPPKHSYAATLDLEVKSWCYGLYHLQERPDPRVVYRVMNELAPVLSEAIRAGYVFNLVAIAEDLAKASSEVVPLKEAVFYVLAQLPHPSTLNTQERNTLGSVIRQVDDEHLGAVKRCCERWRIAPKATSAQYSPVALPSTLPPVFGAPLTGRFAPFQNSK